jgi:hypothetical protein
MTDLPSSQPGRVLARYFEGDLGPRVANPYDEDAAFLKLRRIPVGGRVHLGDIRPELGCVRRHPRDLVGPHGDDNIGRRDTTVSRRDHEPFFVPGKSKHSGSGSNR